MAERAAPPSPQHAPHAKRCLFSLPRYNESLNLIIMEAIHIVSMEPLLQHADLASFVQAAMEDSEDSNDDVDFSKRIREDEFVLSTVTQVFAGLAVSFDRVAEYIQIFEPYRET